MGGGTGGGYDTKGGFFIEVGGVPPKDKKKKDASPVAGEDESEIDLPTKGDQKEAEKIKPVKEE